MRFASALVVLSSLRVHHCSAESVCKYLSVHKYIIVLLSLYLYMVYIEDSSEISYLSVHKPAMDKADVQEVEDGRLVGKLKSLDAAEAGVDIHPSGQLGQQRDRILDVPVQVDSVLLVHSAP